MSTASTGSPATSVSPLPGHTDERTAGTERDDHGQPELAEHCREGSFVCVDPTRLAQVGRKVRGLVLVHDEHIDVVQELARKVAGSAPR